MMIQTDHLEAYPLPEKVADRLRVLDRAAQQLARAGVPVPDRVVIDPGDLAVVDAVVRYHSASQYNARTVQWRGRRLAAA